MNEGITERIRALREEKDLSQPKAAEALGISLSGYQNYEYGKRDIPGDVLIAMSRLYDVTVDYILGFSQYRNKHEQLLAMSSAFVDRPLFGSIAAGTPLEMLPVDDFYPAPKPIVEKYPDGFWLKIASNSMDELFAVGCLVYVNPKKEVDENGKPWALCVNGYDATVKIVDKLENGYRLSPRSTDPTYKPIIYDYTVPGTDKITPIGEIVYDMKPFDWRY